MTHFNVSQIMTRHSDYDVTHSTCDVTTQSKMTRSKIEKVTMVYFMKISSSVPIVNGT